MFGGVSMLISKRCVLRVSVPHGTSAEKVADMILGAIDTFLEWNPKARVRAMGSIDVSSFACTEPGVSVVLIPLIYDED